MLLNLQGQRGSNDDPWENDDVEVWGNSVFWPGWPGART